MLESQPHFHSSVIMGHYKQGGGVKGVGARLLGDAGHGWMPGGGRCPASGRCRAHGWWLSRLFGHDAELLHHGHHVGDAPMF